MRLNCHLKLSLELGLGLPAPAKPNAPQILNRPGTEFHLLSSQLCDPGLLSIEVSVIFSGGHGTSMSMIPGGDKSIEGWMDS